VPFPNFDPVLIHLGPLAIRWYALAYIAGILLGWWYATRLVKQTALWAPAAPPINSRQIDDLVLWITVGVIVGGRAGSVLFYGRDQYVNHPLEVFAIWKGGMSFHGGFIGVMIAIAVYSVVNKIDMLRLGDLVAPCVPFGLFFGRIANFINGELWGRPTSLPWGIIFPGAPDVPPVPRHPSQLYEAVLEGLVLFVILRFATHRLHWLRRQGALTGLFILFYGLFRIALENVRQPDAGLDNLPLGLTMGMILSTPMVVAGAWLVWRAWRLPPVDEATVAVPPAA
jgi:phosphatidylglycerol:prolipoprotein diacylglycerol transferase